MQKFSKIFETLKNNLLKNFGSNPDKMLVYTGVLGWFLSSAAQVFAIAINKEIPKEQKAFLIPQEIGDGAINVLSFFLVTSAFKNLSSKLVSSGKIASKPVREFLTKSIKDGIIDAKQIGKINFDIAKMSNFTGDIVPAYDGFKTGIGLIGTTIGTILSCNIITPLLRNKIAAKRQEVKVAQMHSNKTYTYPRITMDAYLNHATMRSGSLRI